MKILISGSSGFIGKALFASFSQKRHQIFKLVRLKDFTLPNEISWDPEKNLLNLDLIENFDVVIHLAGEPIMGYWTESKKKEIYQSRIRSTELLSKALVKLKFPPSVFITASGVGYYGDRKDEVLTEESPKGSGFLSDVCAQWEESSKNASENGIRTVNLRNGIVLSSSGGALKQMLLPFRFCLGGQLGDGHQYMSWIHLDDLVRLINDVIQNTHLEGPLNAVSPFPVTNQFFTKTLGAALNKPTVCNLPVWAVKMILGQMGEEVLLASQRVKPEKIQNAGFSFSYPDLKIALDQILKS